jgi:hypothetical protein
MKLCTRCGHLYRDNALVCPACYEIISGRFVLRERKPTEPQRPIPTVQVTDRVKYPANLSKTRWYWGNVVAVNGDDTAKIEFDNDCVRIVRLRDCVLVVSEPDADPVYSEAVWRQTCEDAEACAMSYEIEPPHECAEKVKHDRHDFVTWLIR